MAVVCRTLCVSYCITAACHSMRRNLTLKCLCRAVAISIHQMSIIETPAGPLPPWR